MNILKEDTICAIATPQGEGAVAMIRVSGEKSFEIVEKIFKPTSKKSLKQQKSHTLHYGEIIDKENILDEVLVAIYKAPHSYTGENSIEIFCHGSLYIQQRILEILIEAGARLSEPGEFTLRAFLNKKIDLSQAEGVADLIASKSQISVNLAIKQLKGEFSKEIYNLRDKLLELLSLIELELDFAEEDVEFADRTELFNVIEQIENWTSQLLNNFSLGNAIKEGIPVAIVGKTNVGKSTLLNLLLKEDKAIVSDIPGTTRDVVEDTININGVRFRIIDTAGIRNTNDTIENMGIVRSFKAIKEAVLILFVTDITQTSEEIKEYLEKIQNSKQQQAKIIGIVNKIDLNNENITEKISELFDKQELPHIKISAKDEKSINAVNKIIFDTLGIARFFEEETFLINERHYQALKKISDAIKEIKKGLDLELPTDLLTQEIHQILYYLGEISGEVSSEDVLQNIFSKFCIGK